MLSTFLCTTLFPLSPLQTLFFVNYYCPSIPFVYFAYYPELFFLFCRSLQFVNGARYLFCVCLFPFRFRRQALFSAVFFVDYYPLVLLVFSVFPFVGFLIFSPLSTISKCIALSLAFLVFVFYTGAQSVPTYLSSVSLFPFASAVTLLVTLFFFSTTVGRYGSCFAYYRALLLFLYLPAYVCVWRSLLYFLLVISGPQFLFCVWFLPLLAPASSSFCHCLVDCRRSVRFVFISSSGVCFFLVWPSARFLWSSNVCSCGLYSALRFTLPTTSVVLGFRYRSASVLLCCLCSFVSYAPFFGLFFTQQLTVGRYVLRFAHQPTLFFSLSWPSVRFLWSSATVYSCGLSLALCFALPAFFVLLGFYYRSTYNKQ